VYGGAEFVPACLDSAARLPGLNDTVDVLVLDDCSPDELWSLEMRARCADLGLAHYRSPRNLGIPRNMNLAFRRAMSSGYDNVIIANSDVVFPAALVSGLNAVAEGDPSIASVTAWSNHVSAFSLTNSDPERYVASEAAVDRVSGILESRFGAMAVDLPVGVGFCMLVPTRIVERVGLFDPVFGRGYCEEVDWCLRARLLGLRNVLAPAVFVYHLGNATTKTVGMLEESQTSVPLNDAIIDLRYPEYRKFLRQHDQSRELEQIRNDAERALVLEPARERGYVVAASWLDHDDGLGDLARFVVEPSGSRSGLRGFHRGFEARFNLSDENLLDELERLTGSLPTRITISDRGWRSDALAEQARLRSVPCVDAYDYPELVGRPDRTEDLIRAEPRPA
jgi:GT2 family glycosyltransferase